MSKPKPAIEIRGLSKAYMIGHEQETMAGTMTFRDSLVNLARKPAEILTGHQLKKEKFWALKDVSLDIERGDVVGIIGRNGSGKSTLLKVLSRIVEPTKGEAVMHGRVASLLEVGTGFHPELTGRENVYFNGAILGMTRKEIQAKFDEIVAFSEIEQFLDTPVKFYSSGMYVRLAFAVAAHLDPDILIVDEVLAVGDAEFQKKCLGKMRTVAGEGRTVLFVSHNMNAITQLCSKGIFLKKGVLQGSAMPINEAVTAYLGDGKEAESTEWKRVGNEFENKYYEATRLALTDSRGRTKHQIINSNEDNFITMEGKILTQDLDLKLGYTLYGPDGLAVYTTQQTDTSKSAWPKIKKGNFVLRSQLPKRLLNEGDYRLELTSSIHNKVMLTGLGFDAPFIHFRINGGLSDSPHYITSREGVIAPIVSWELIHD